MSGEKEGPGILASLWRYRYLVGIVALLAAVGGYAFGAAQPETFEADARIVLADPRNLSAFGDSVRLNINMETHVLKQAERMGSRAVRTRASELLGAEVSPDGIARQVTVEADVMLDQITIWARAENDDLAARLANAVAEAYQADVIAGVRGRAENASAQLADSRQELEGALAAAETALGADPENPALVGARDAAAQQLLELRSREQQIEVDAALYGSGVEVFEPAESPSSPVAPRPARTAAAALILALTATGGFAYWRAGSTQAARFPEDAAAVLDAPLLGEIPTFQRAATPTFRTPDTPNSIAQVMEHGVAEAYHFAFASILFALDDSDGRSILVTSAASGDGKTETALNLSVAAARDGRRVVLADADERMRALTERLGFGSAMGLTNLGAGAPYEVCAKTLPIPKSVESLQFVPAGAEAEDAAGFFRTPGFRKAIHTAKGRADFLIVDSPPLLAVADTSAIAGQLDGVVLVVDRGTPVAMLEQVRKRMDFIGTPLLGYVFNRSRSMGRRGRNAAYAYGYGKKQISARTSATHQSPWETASAGKG